MNHGYSQDKGQITAGENFQKFFRIENFTFSIEDFIFLTEEFFFKQDKKILGNINGILLLH